MVIEQRVQQVQSVLHKAGVVLRVDAHAAQGDDDLRGGLGVPRAPAAEIRRVQLELRQALQRSIHRVLHIQGGGAVVRPHGLYGHGRDVRIGGAALRHPQVKAVVAELIGQDGLYQLRAGIAGACGDGVLHAVQRNQSPEPAVQPLPSQIRRFAPVIHAVGDQVDIRAVFIPAEVGGVAAARQHRQRDAVPFRRLCSVQLVRLAVFLLHIRSQRRQIAVVVVLRAVAGQPDGQPVGGGAAGIGQQLAAQQRLTLRHALLRPLPRQYAVDGLGDVRHAVFPLGHHLTLVGLCRRVRLLLRHGRDADGHVTGEGAVLELHAAEDVGILHRRDITPCLLAPLGIPADLDLHRAGEEVGMLQCDRLHIVHSVDRDAAGGLSVLAFAHRQRHTGDFACGQSMPLVGRQVQHICAVYAHFLKHPIGQVVPCRGVDGDAVPRRVSCGYHAQYQHQRQQKRCPILYFSSHRGIPPTSVYIAVFAWTEFPPTRIDRLRPRRNQV